MTTNNPPQIDWLGKASFAGALAPYIFMMCIGASFFFAGMQADSAFLRDGLRAGGGMLMLLSFGVGFVELIHQWDGHVVQLDVIRSQNGLLFTGQPTPQDNASSAPVNPEPHTVWLGQATEGGSTLKRYEIKPGERPTQQFIEWVKRFTENNPRGRVPEREAMAMEEYASHANAWLSCMDRVGILEREDERPNAARRWKGSVSLANALAIFEYAPSGFLPIPPTPLLGGSGDKTT